MKREHSIRINFNEYEWTNVVALVGHLGVSTPQELVRFLIAQRIHGGGNFEPAQSSNGMRPRGRPPGPAKMMRKEREDEHVYQMNQMTDEELTKHLRDIGYFLDDGKGYTHKIETTPAGRFYVQELGAPDSESYYRAEVFDMNELFNDMRKEKKL